MNCKTQKRLKRIDRRVAAIYAKLFPLPTPAEFTIKLVSERIVENMNLLTYEATLPAFPTGTDVVSQYLEVSVDGAPPVAQSLSATTTTATFEVPQDSNVTLSLIYVDDGGNQSPAKTQEFVAKDTIPPDAPGDFGEVRLVSERDVP